MPAAGRRGMLRVRGSVYVSLSLFRHISERAHTHTHTHTLTVGSCSHTSYSVHHSPGKEKEGGREKGAGKEGGREGTGKEEGVIGDYREMKGKNKERR